ncbi:Cell division cycle protein 123 [Ceratocystis lukuohia]|uniref:Cell division cycle protein 123 n=1 Tax=Ceratocystis lukuohia TaxID=2019550 RepID=A0ABR4MDH1_9PEZI
MPEATGSTSPSGENKFPPIKKSHMVNCAYDQWFPRYRTSCIKSRIVPLTEVMVSYFKEDGILLADDDEQGKEETADEEWHSTGPISSGVVREVYSDDESEEEEEERTPPNVRFPVQHKLIKDAIQELGGSVVPKLNWSTPKDAAWISRHQNTLKCTSPNDIYLLLKSSSFVTHDLEHAFEETIDDYHPTSHDTNQFKYALVLRPFFNMHPALEFRCFVKQRNLIGICQRDLNYYDFLFKLKTDIIDRVDDFFESKLRMTFPDDSFVFDVYIPEDNDTTDGTGLGRLRLIDINPWASTTDSILFDWKELLNKIVPQPLIGPPPVASFSSSSAEKGEQEGFVRLKLDGAAVVDILESTDSSTDDDDYLEPDLRLVNKEDPSAYNFSSTQYSAHKLPKEVVDAGLDGQGGMREFARQWKEATEGRGGEMFQSPTGGQ